MQPYRKQNNSFQANKNFNRTGMNPYVLAPNGNNKVATGANATPLAIKCSKCNGSNYSRYCKNKKNGVLHNLQEEPTVEDIEGTS